MTNVIDLPAKQQKDDQVIQDNRSSMQGLDPSRYVFCEAAFREENGFRPERKVPKVSKQEQMATKEKFVRHLKEAKVKSVAAKSVYRKAQELLRIENNGILDEDSVSPHLLLSAIVKVRRLEQNKTSKLRS